PATAATWSVRAQVERHRAGTDHVAAVAGDAELAIDLASLLGRVGAHDVGAGERGAQHEHAGRAARRDAAPRRRACCNHPYTFFWRSAATWIGGIQGLAAQPTPLRATCASIR